MALTKLCAAALCAAALTWAPRSAASGYHMESLSINEGLSQNYAGTILRDSRGYLWIGTKFGLNRYDHFSHVKTYFASKEGGALPSDNIRHVFETPGGEIWVLCENGTAVYQPLTDTFREIRYEHDKPLNLWSAYTDGRLVVLGGRGQLYKLDCATRKLSRLNTTGGSGSYYTQIHPLDSNNALLVTRWDGIWNYNRQTGEITRYPGIDCREVTSAAIDTLGRIWVAVYNQGVRCYNRSGRLLAEIDRSNSDLECNIVLDIGHGTAPDELWLATDGAGVRSLRTETREIEPISDRGGQSVVSIYKDTYGNLYSGTIDEGVQLFSKTAMETSGTFPGKPETRLFPTSFLDDPDDPDGIYLSTNGEGLWHLDKPSGRYRLVGPTKGMKIYRVERYDDHRLIISRFGDGVYLVDPRSGNMVPAPEPFQEAAAAAIKRGTGTDIRKLRKGLYAAVNADIYIIDTENGTGEKIEIPGRPEKAAFMRPFYNDTNVLMTFAHNFVARYDFNTGKAEVVASYPDEMNISCAQFDGANNIYLGCGGGVRRLDLRNATTEPLPGYSTDKRHLNVTSMLLDGEDLWAGCSNSLLLIGLSRLRTSEFTTPDGVAPNEFLERARYADADRILMGGSKGLLSIDREALREIMNYSSPITFSLSDIEVDGRSLMADTSEDGVVDIPHQYGTLNISFIDNELNPLRHKRYRFFINDGKKTSTVETDCHELMLPMLANATDYEISVASTLIDGGWSEPVRVASLRVASPAWRSWWAILLYVAGISAAAAMLYYNRRNARRAKAQAARQAQIEKERDFIQSINNELRTPLTLIYAPLKLMLAKLQETAPDAPELKELNGIYRNTKRMRDVMDITFHQWRTQSGAQISGTPGEEPPGDGAEAKEPKQHEGDVLTDMSVLTVMICENDGDMCAFLRRQLEPLFHKVAVFTSGPEAAEALKSGRVMPDLVLTSDLPLASGIKSSERSRHIPVIFLSSVIGQQDKQEVYRRDIDSYLSKPFDMAVLLSRCGNLLRSRQVMRERYKGPVPDIISKERVRDNASEEFILKVNQIIERQLSNADFSMETLAQEMLMSRSSLYARFREVSGGQSVGQYITDYRMNRAKELLTGTRLPLGEIASMLGYSSQRYFSSAFKQRAGMTPSAFRSATQSGTAS